MKGGEIVLQQVLESIHNYFIQSPNPGKYTIEGGMISPLPSLLEGQRIWIVGSALNDGVYTYHQAGITNDDETEAADLKNETFNGSVCALAVPRELIALSKEISDWNDQYGEKLNSPYRSENVIGVYSYEMKGGGGSYGAGVITWQTQFADRLKRWRRISL